MAQSGYGRFSDRSSRDVLMVERQRQLAIEVVVVLLCVLFAVALALRLLAAGSTPMAELDTAITTAPVLWPGR